jgi:secondary thiamine-phosphate synthase enzyme
MTNSQHGTKWRSAVVYGGGFRVVTSSIRVQTQGNNDVIDITRAVQQRIGDTELKDGTVTVFVQGSTAALTTIEYEPGTINDLSDLFEQLVPANQTYTHDERWQRDDAHAHLRASLLGPSITVPFVDGYMTLGSWQQIVLVDFDTRSRLREIVVQIMGE